MNKLIILFAALLPAILLWFYIWKSDIQKEPMSKLVKAIVWGMAICFPVALVEMLVELFLFDSASETLTLADTTMRAFFTAAIPEESFKLLALWIVLRKNPFFDEHFDGIVYAVCVGLGFAAVENILYLFSSDDWVKVAISRALLAVPGHYAFAVIMGYFYSVYHFTHRSPKIAVSVLLVPVLAHGIYDAIAMSGMVHPYIGTLSFFILIFFCIRMHKYARKKMLLQIERDKLESFEL